MAATAPPPEVLLAFLATLNKTVSDFEETLVPVARGSLLLQHWFGELARPAADLDLECFEGPRPPSEYDEDEEEDYDEGNGFGRHGEYSSLVDFGKAMCRYAANTTQYYQWSNSYERPSFEFTQAVSPGEGASLWTYGTPGERYFAGWAWHDAGQSGRMQIDIAASGYQLDEIATAPVKLTTANGSKVKCPAYTPETLLAAKLSWLVRSFQRPAADGAIAWKGEPKDLFDAHLLLTQAKLKPALLQKSLLAMGAQDALKWNELDVVFAAGHAMDDKDFANWPAFHKKHKDLLESGPAEMMRAVAGELEPLLGDFYRREEMPFLRAINSGVPDEVAHLVYADWLEENGHGERAELLRELTTYSFRKGELPEKKRDANRAAIKAMLPNASHPWLCQLFGTSAKATELSRQFEASDA